MIEIEKIASYSWVEQLFEFMDSIVLIVAIQLKKRLMCINDSWCSSLAKL